MKIEILFRICFLGVYISHLQLLDLISKTLRNGSFLLYILLLISCWCAIHLKMNGKFSNNLLLLSGIQNSHLKKIQLSIK